LDTTTLLALVRGFTLFSNVPAADCASIISAAHEKRFWRRQTIFSEGDPVQQVVMLLSGCVKITQLGLSGNEIILRLYGVSEVVEAPRLCANCSHCSTARVVQPCKALVWDAPAFEKLVERFPAFRRNTVRALEERLQEMEQRFREISTEEVASRLSSELIRLTDRLGHAVDGHREITLSHWSWLN
jgi:CRP-like cAMP-binding protein